MPSISARPWRVVALALFAGVFLTAQPMLMNEVTGHRMTLSGMLSELLFWVVWAGFTPLILAAAKRWPLGFDGSWRPLLPHALISIPLAPIPDFTARRHTGEHMKAAEEPRQRFIDAYKLRGETSLEPRAFLRLTDNWTELSLRFIAPVHGTRALKDAMSRDILEQLRAVGIPVASATMDVTVRQPST